MAATQRPRRPASACFCRRAQSRSRVSPWPPTRCTGQGFPHKHRVATVTRMASPGDRKARGFIEQGLDPAGHSGRELRELSRSTGSRLSKRSAGVHSRQLKVIDHQRARERVLCADSSQADRRHPTRLYTNEPRRRTLDAQAGLPVGQPQLPMRGLSGWANLGPSAPRPDRRLRQKPLLLPALPGDSRTRLTSKPLQRKAPSRPGLQQPSPRSQWPVHAGRSKIRRLRTALARLLKNSNPEGFWEASRNGAGQG